MAYQALVGCLPFVGDTATTVFLAISRGEYLPPSHHVESLVDAVDSWFAKAFDLDPAKRFATAHEMATAFLVATESGRSGIEFKLRGTPEKSPDTATAPTAPAALSPDPQDPLDVATLKPGEETTAVRAESTGKSELKHKTTAKPEKSTSELPASELTMRSPTRWSRFPGPSGNKRVVVLGALVVSLSAAVALALTGGRCEPSSPTTPTHTPSSIPTLSSAQAIVTDSVTNVPVVLAPDASCTDGCAGAAPTAPTNTSRTAVAKPLKQPPLRSTATVSKEKPITTKPQPSGSAPPGRPAHCPEDGALIPEVLDGGQVHWVFRPECQ